MAYIGEFAALGTGICWAIGGNLFAAAGRRIGSDRLNRLRLVVGTILLAGSLWIVRGSPWPTWATGAQVGLLTLSGLIGFVFGDSFGFRSIVILGPGRASLFTSLAPIFTALIAWPVLGESLGPRAILGIALTLGGLLWVMQGRAHAEHHPAEGSVLVGIVSGVLAALGQAGGYVLSKMALRGGLDPLSATVIRVVTATAAIWIFTVFRSDVKRTLVGMKNPGTAAFVAGGSFLGPFLGVTLSLLALKYTKAGIAATITAFYPILTLAIASHFHREKVTWTTVAGALVSVSGVVLLFLH